MPLTSVAYVFICAPLLTGGAPGPVYWNAVSVVRRPAALVGGTAQEGFSAARRRRLTPDEPEPHILWKSVVRLQLVANRRLSAAGRGSVLVSVVAWSRYAVVKTRRSRRVL